MGSGTTLVEAKLLNRNAIGVDINPQSVLISETNLQFQCETKSKIYTRTGSAIDLHFIKDTIENCNNISKGELALEKKLDI